MPGRILIADDVATNRIILKVKLASASYDVWQVDSALGLVGAARNDRPDLIIMDADLPDCDSFQICRDLKEDPESTAIPIMIMTANYGRDIRLRALRAGADDILPKSFDDQVLLARVRNLLRVRGMEEELRRRQGTAAEFGFHEAGAEFEDRAQVVVVRKAGGACEEWENAFSDQIDAEVSILDQTRVLEIIGQRQTGPDVIVLPAEDDQTQSALTLVAELRSRRETRHCAIIVCCNATDKSTAIAALDMGANDLFETGSLPEEAVCRVRVQLERKRKADRLRNTLEDGLRLAVTDPLTGLFNRRYALPHTAKIAARAQETGKPFAVMVLDLDRFKRINDTYGHAAGDTVLKVIAQRLKDNLRSVDLLCRLGGEEFLVVMPETDFQAARGAAERLRRVTEATPIFISPEKGEIAVTVSIGVSIGGVDGLIASQVEQIVDRADQALLGAKSHGRNQVTFGQTAA